MSRLTKKAINQLLEQMLRNAGYTCITSTRDPYAVCALHRDNHYDLILLDLQMPGMDGFQVMEGLNEIETNGYLPGAGDHLRHEAALNHAKILESLALNDPLTGLANRRLLTDRMSMALVHARRNKSAMGVVYLKRIRLMGKIGGG